jgi:hypothetical protein
MLLKAESSMLNEKKSKIDISTFENPAFAGELTVLSVASLFSACKTRRANTKEIEKR